MLYKLEDSFSYEYLKELTVEAGRPDSITEDRLLAMKRHRVTRISINPQTMQQKTLDLIGRKHTVEQTKEAFHLARGLGFDNINMDLILGLPGETAADVRSTMEEIRKLSPDSATLHSLGAEAGGTAESGKEKYEPVSAEEMGCMMDIASSYAADMGLKPYYLYRQKNMAGNYENVGYAKVDKAGIYNILIMEEKQTIVACGAGASTKAVIHSENRIERVENVKNVEQYIDRIGEMIDRKRQFFEKNPVSGALSQEQVAMDDLERELAHGMTVSCLARRLGRELGLSEEEQYQLAVAGLLHDIGKCRLSSYLYGNAQIELNVEKMKYVRTHSRLSYDILKEKGYEEPILEAVRYHHENYDGSGYPDNLAGEDIPYMARILRVCDVFAALTSDRRYRSAFSADTAMELMIEEIKNFDMGIFLAFQRIAHEAGTVGLPEHEAAYTGGRGMITQAPRGVQDWYGENMHKRAVVEKIARDLAKTYNMTEIITPMFEHTVLFQRGVGETTDVVQKEMYTFKDKGDRSITLKPEGTAGVMRAYLEHNMYAQPAPTKLYYVTQAFRYEKPQSGRLRQHHQFGVEFVGSKSPLAEVEVISLADDPD